MTTPYPEMPVPNSPIVDPLLREWAAGKGLGNGVPGYGGQANLLNLAEPRYFRNPETGELESLTYAQYAERVQAQYQGETPTVKDFNDYVDQLEQYSYRDDGKMLDVHERYQAGTGQYWNVYDAETEDGYKAGLEGGLMTNDGNNPFNMAFQSTKQLADAYDSLPASAKPKAMPAGATYNPGAQPVPQTIYEKAEWYLDYAGFPQVDELSEVRANYGRGSGGAPTTIRTVNETTPQELRSMNTDQQIGRSLGVGESRRLAKALNKEANKNPSVTSGLRSGNQKTTPGFDIAQGLTEAIQSSPDGVRYQQAVRGMDILEEALLGRSGL